MSELEAACKPFIISLISGEVVNFSEADRANICNYFTMKAMVADTNQENAHVFSYKEKAEFYRSRNIPEGCFISLFRYNQMFDPFVPVYNKERMLAFVEEGTGDRQGVTNITFRFGVALVQVALFRMIGDISHLGSEYRLKLHPSTLPTVRWPPLFAIDRRMAIEVQHALEVVLPTKFPLPRAT